MEKLFEQFEGYLQGHGYQAQGGQILEATLVPVPKQHMSQEENEGDGVWADSAYRSALIEWFLVLLNWCSHINERGYRNHPLTEEQKENNRPVRLSSCGNFRAASNPTPSRTPIQ